MDIRSVALGLFVSGSQPARFVTNIGESLFATRELSFRRQKKTAVNRLLRLKGETGCDDGDSKTSCELSSAWLRNNLGAGGARLFLELAHLAQSDQTWNRRHVV